MKRRSPWLRYVTALALSSSLMAQSPKDDLPHLDRSGAHPALIVDGAPFLMLSAQVNNSSAWPATMPAVWSVMDQLGTNTLEAPVYWQTLEPTEGVFDFAQTDLLITQARAHGKRLVLLWFGTWKNGSPGYTPEWVKRDPQRFPFARDRNGRPVYSLSPFGQASLLADERAFSTLMQHLKSVDAQHTVIMVQVENEPGIWGAARDYSPAANRVFNAPVPREALQAMGKAGMTGTWPEIFGADADEDFYAWAVARYIDQVAAAGKKVNPLPMYTNAALRDPLPPGTPGSFESGGATFDVLPLWHAAAPTLDGIEPDLYMPEPAKVSAIFAQYALPWNAFFVPETGNKPGYAHFFFQALGHGAMGWSPFGMDASGYFNAPLGAADMGSETLAPVQRDYAIAALFDGELARFLQQGRVVGTAEDSTVHAQTVSLQDGTGKPGSWSATISYGLPAFYSNRLAPGNAVPEGEALLVSLGPDEFLVSGVNCRVDFTSTVAGKQKMWISVEEGSFRQGTWHGTRLWNGDQTDYGLNFTTQPQLLRVRLAAF